MGIPILVRHLYIEMLPWSLSAQCITIELFQGCLSSTEIPMIKIKWFLDYLIVKIAIPIWKDGLSIETGPSSLFSHWLGAKRVKMIFFFFAKFQLWTHHCEMGYYSLIHRGITAVSLPWIRTLSQYKDHLSRCRDSYVKDKTVARQSYLWHGILIPVRRHLYIETAPRCHRDDFLIVQ